MCAFLALNEPFVGKCDEYAVTNGKDCDAEPYEPLDHGGGDVLAVPAGPYADTSGEPGRVRHYAVAAVADGASAGPLSDAVAAAPTAGGPAAVTIEVGAACGTAPPGRRRSNGRSWPS